MNNGAAILACSAVLLFASDAHAQTIRGRVRDEQSGAAVTGGFVRLLDVNGKKIAEMLTNSTGAFQLSAVPGTYVMRVERLGYKTYATQPFRLDTAMVRDVTVPQEAIELPAISASAETNCDVKKTSAAAAAVWEEVRKALSITAWTSRQKSVEFEIVTATSILHPQTRFVLQSTADTSTSRSSGSPFESLSIDSLVNHGFIQNDPYGAPAYYGPDADLILSDAFQDVHCFHAVVDRKRPTLVGLAFEPSSKVTFPDIRGTLWIDKRSYELTRLEFSYTRLPVSAELNTAGGDISFARLDTGMWIVSEWTLSAPVMSMESSLSTRTGGSLELSSSTRGTLAGIQRLSQKVVKASMDKVVVYRAKEPSR